MFNNKIGHKAKMTWKENKPNCQSKTKTENFFSWFKSNKVILQEDFQPCINENIERMKTDLQDIKEEIQHLTEIVSGMKNLALNEDLVFNRMFRVEHAIANCKILIFLYDKLIAMCFQLAKYTTSNYYNKEGFANMANKDRWVEYNQYLASELKDLFKFVDDNPKVLFLA